VQPFFRVKAVIISYSECAFVSIGIQHAVHMRHISSVASAAVRFISTLFHKLYDFRGGGGGGIFLKKIFFFFFLNLLSKIFFFRGVGVEI